MHVIVKVIRQTSEQKWLGYKKVQGQSKAIMVICDQKLWYQVRQHFIKNPVT